ncbi:GNAT family N-acetyltransferase [Shewanella cyperi]|uniref:GNAT family N-acetyltransferase n=2 Tax=Shewanella cyperi TaxID=2814292 RepID=A0A974XM84_9GAMM|nr:GNAT family N-acetyltransferase [Shewanella cyperi]QSX41761.1 GNAT family N-acetyltransferase [Shewanella cyperi]
MTSESSHLSSITVRPMTEDDFDSVIALGLKVHGGGYLDIPHLQALWHSGIKDGINPSYVAVRGDELLGFRLTLAAGQWQPDRWCSPELWQLPKDKVCYFKSNTLAEAARGHGLGGRLLLASARACARQGALGGIAHLWQESPHNAAVRYFAKAGGRLIKAHPDRWNQSHDNPDYVCVRCGTDCHCTACEMLLSFDKL